METDKHQGTIEVKVSAGVKGKGQRSSKIEVVEVGACGENGFLMTRS